MKNPHVNERHNREHKYNGELTRYSFFSALEQITMTMHGRETSCQNNTYEAAFIKLET